MIGSNTSEAHPIIAMEMKRAVRRGATMVVADPRKIWMSTIAEKHLQLKPGCDVWLLNAMAHVICEEGLVDETFVAENTEGFEAVRETVRRYSPEAAEEHTGISGGGHPLDRPQVRDDREGEDLLHPRDHRAHPRHGQRLRAREPRADDGAPGQALLRHEPPARAEQRAGRQRLGGDADLLPGYQRVDDPEVRAVRGGVGHDAVPRAGAQPERDDEAGGEEHQRLFVMGEDVVLSEPNCLELEKGMNAAEFVVVQDAFLNETCRFADVVFPVGLRRRRASSPTRSAGCSGSARPWSPPVRPAGLADPDRLRQRLRRRTGRSTWRVYDELARDADKFSGISHARLDATVDLPKTGLQWPCPSPEHPGTTFLHEEGILRGKGLFQAVDYRPPAELPDEQYGLLLSTGRTLYHYNCATQTRRESGLDAKQSEAWVEMHPRDAKRRGIEDRDMVEVTTRRGSVQVRALSSRQVQPRCIWMPLHFFEARANLITNDAGDPVTDTAEYKVCAAEVRKVDEAERGEGLYPGTFYGVDAPA